MKIVSMYKEYFHKSRVFLYPALGIKKGVSVTPIQTYMSWQGRYEVSDRKLCCLYHLRDDADFKSFEQLKLLGNRHFHEFIQVEEKQGVYVFDLSIMKEDWDHVLNGKYSKISKEHKQSIRHFIGLNSPHLPYIDLFLFPNKHFHLYSELSGIEVDVLKDVGELCDLPDLDKETLKVPATNLQIIKEKP